MYREIIKNLPQRAQRTQRETISRNGERKRRENAKT